MLSQAEATFAPIISKSSNLFACICIPQNSHGISTGYSFFRDNLDLCSVFGVVDTPVYNHAKPSNNVWSPLTM